MASTQHSTQLLSLGEPHQRDRVGQQLQAPLAELVDLSLLAKQLHWNVVGPLFRPLHLQFDELIDSWRELDAASQDVVIEVVRALEEQLWLIRVQFPDDQTATEAPR